MDRNNSSPYSTSIIAGFVKDALELEKEICSLQELGKRLKQKATVQKRDATVKYEKIAKRMHNDQGMSDQEKVLRTKLSEAEKRLKSQKGAIEKDIQAIYEKAEKKILSLQNQDCEKKADLEMKKNGNDETIGAMFLFFCLYVIVMFAVIGIAFVLGDMFFSSVMGSLEIFAIIMALPCFVSIVVAEVIFYKWHRRHLRKKTCKRIYKESLEKIREIQDKLPKQVDNYNKKTEKEIQEIEREICSLRAQLMSPTILSQRITKEQMDETQRVYDVEMRIANSLEEQAEACAIKASNIAMLLREGYERSNIVPPDYRYINCIAVLHHAFRNGLADNMKEAILYYEEKEYREKSLKGLDNIYYGLKQLSVSVMELRGVLSDIDNSISGVMERMDISIANETIRLSNEIRYQQESLEIDHARQYAEREHHRAQEMHNKWIELQILHDRI